MKQLLKRSQFVVALAHALRGFSQDMSTLGAFVRRNAQITSYLQTHEIKKLHIGTSNNLLDGWLNTDIFPCHKTVVYMNATARFPFDENTFDYIMAEHMIEHIDYNLGQVMLKECFRVLKPAGRVRFATPDLRVLLGLHSVTKTNAQEDYLNWIVKNLMPEVRECKDVFVINNCFRAWGHQFLYDQETLRHALERQGFCDITFYKPGVSESRHLQNLESHGKEIQAEHINQFETTVVEARKEARHAA